MNDAQAKREAKKRWGAKAYVRNGGHFTSPERRAAALQTVRDARNEIKEIDAEITRRLQELDWFRELHARKRDANKRIRETEGDAHAYRFNVGSSEGIFNSIKGYGDTWEEAFERADKNCVSED